MMNVKASDIKVDELGEGAGAGAMAEPVQSTTVTSVKVEPVSGPGETELIV